MINYEFLNTNKSQLFEIYKKERFMNNGGAEGALILDFRKPDNVDVYYWTVEDMVDHIKKIFLEQYKKDVSENKKNLVYVILIDNENVKMEVYQV
jgi:cyclophilin family peptidyl-prolyl cis-trans isomerase